MVLKRSFVHLPGVGPVKERKLWERGIRDWSELRAKLAEVYLDEARRSEADRFIAESERAHAAGDLGFFQKHLPRDHAWRMVDQRFDQVAYLDIETTGIGFPPMSHSTTITFFHRGQVFQEHDHELKRKLIAKMVAEAPIWATFFGTGFDLPFLRHEYRMELDVPHVDLCFWLRRLGHRGGLKRIQKLFAEIPARQAMDIDGADAVRLWKLHRRGVEGALETLLHYNAEDTVVLEPLLAIAFNAEVERSPELGLAKVAVPAMHELATRVHRPVYDLLRAGQASVVMAI